MESSSFRANQIARTLNICPFFLSYKNSSLHFVLFRALFALSGGLELNQNSLNHVI